MFDEKAYKKAWREANKDRIKIQQALWHEANKETIREKSRNRYAANVEVNSAKAKRYYQENKEKLKAAARAYASVNKDKVNAAAKIYFEAHKEAILNKRKEWLANNADRVKEYQRRYRESRRKSKSPEEEALSQLPKSARQRLAKKAYRERNPAKVKAQKDKWRISNPAAVRGQSQRRRALKSGAKIELFPVVEIYERDGWVCQLCHKKVNKRLKYPDPLSASLDHIVPLSKGGEHSRANVHLAHLICNKRAGTGGMKQLRMIA